MKVKARKRTKVPVTARALVQRLNRSLVHEGAHGWLLKKTKGMRALVDLGDYYVIDIDRNMVVDKFVDLEVLGRKRKVLAAFEELRNGK
jgi:hypothetical protein